MNRTTAAIPVAAANEEQRLVLAFQRGDTSAFDELVRLNQASVLRFCTRRLRGDRDAAEEVVQEALLKAHAALPSLHGERRFGAWLHVIAARQCVDYIRRNHRALPSDPQTMHSTLAHPEGDSFVDGIAERDRAHRTLRQALPRLHPRHRQALELSIIDALPRESVAEVMDTPMTTLEPLLSRARAALRREVARLAGFLTGCAAVIKRLRDSLTQTSGTIAVSASIIGAALVATVAHSYLPPSSPSDTARRPVIQVATISDTRPEPTSNNPTHGSPPDETGPREQSRPPDTTTTPTGGFRLSSPVLDVDKRPGSTQTEDQAIQVWVAGFGVGISPRGRLPEQTPGPVKDVVESPELRIGEPQG